MNVGKGQTVPPGVTIEGLWERVETLSRERDEARESAAATTTALDAALEQLKVVGGARDRAMQCLTDISRERGELVLLLRELEWRGATSITYPSTLLPSCPWCGRARVNRHREDCRLKAALEANDAAIASQESHV